MEPTEPIMPEEPEASNLLSPGKLNKCLYFILRGEATLNYYDCNHVRSNMTLKF